MDSDCVALSHVSGSTLDNSGELTQMPASPGRVEATTLLPHSCPRTDGPREIGNAHLLSAMELISRMSASTPDNSAEGKQMPASPRIGVWSAVLPPPIRMSSSTRDALLRLPDRGSQIAHRRQIRRWCRKLRPSHQGFRPSVRSVFFLRLHALCSIALPPGGAVRIPRSSSKVLKGDWRSSPTCSTRPTRSWPLSGDWR